MTDIIAFALSGVNFAAFLYLVQHVGTAVQ